MPPAFNLSQDQTLQLIFFERRHPKATTIISTEERAWRPASAEQIRAGHTGASTGADERQTRRIQYQGITNAHEDALRTPYCEIGARGFLVPANTRA